MFLLLLQCGLLMQRQILKNLDVIITCSASTMLYLSIAVNLLSKVQNQEQQLSYLTSEEDIYNGLKDIYVNRGHRSSDKMFSIIYQNYVISEPYVEMFLKACKLF